MLFGFVLCIVAVVFFILSILNLKWKNTVITYVTLIGSMSVMLVSIFKCWGIF
jgi:hypothetical protein